MFFTRVLLILALFGAVSVMAGPEPFQERSDEDELNLSERGIFSRLCHRFGGHSKRELPEDELGDDDVDELVARVARLQPESRGWLKKVWRHVKPHAGTLAKAALAAGVGK